jgi:hypothetical protein
LTSLNIDICPKQAGTSAVKVAENSDYSSAFLAPFPDLSKYHVKYAVFPER